MSRKSFSILIVDDSRMTRAMFGRVLGMIDLPIDTILEAENGAAALRVLEDVHVDLVLADLNMPVLDGFEMIARMRGDDRWRDVPVVVISAQPDPDRIEALKQLGVVAYLPKPATAENMRDAILPILAPPPVAPPHPEEKKTFNLALAEALASALETMAFMSPELVSDCGIPHLTGEERIVRVDFAGKDSRGSLALAASREFMAVLSENVGDAPTAGLEDDALMELANVTCGMLLRMRPAGGSGFHLAPPLVTSAAEAHAREIFEKGDAVALRAGGNVISAQVVIDAAFFGE